MAISLSVAVRNAQLDAIGDALNAGAGANAVIELVTAGGTVLTTFNLQDPAFAAASSGTKALLGVPLASTASASGQAAEVVARDKDGVECYRASVSLAGGGGDAVISPSLDITTGDTVNLNSHILG